jgi:hypothetical protein
VDNSDENAAETFLAKTSRGVTLKMPIYQGRLSTWRGLFVDVLGCYFIVGAAFQYG